MQIFMLKKMCLVQILDRCIMEVLILPLWFGSPTLRNYVELFSIFQTGLFFLYLRLVLMEVVYLLLFAQHQIVHNLK